MSETTRSEERGTPTPDLVERLRSNDSWVALVAASEAADRLAALSRQVEALTGALRGVGYFDPEADGELCWCGDDDDAAADEHDPACLKARAALAGKEVGSDG